MEETNGGKKLGGEWEHKIEFYENVECRSLDGGKKLRKTRRRCEICGRSTCPQAIHAVEENLILAFLDTQFKGGEIVHCFIVLSPEHNWFQI